LGQALWPQWKEGLPLEKIKFSASYLCIIKDIRRNTPGSTDDAEIHEWNRLIVPLMIDVSLSLKFGCVFCCLLGEVLVSSISTNDISY
jgi:hypothetical protein